MILHPLYYFEQIEPKLLVFEQKRKHVLIIFLCLLGIQFIVFFCIGFFCSIIDYNTIRPFVLVICAIVNFIVMIYSRRNKYIKFYKKEIIPALLKGIFGKNEYYPFKGMSKKYVNQIFSGFFAISRSEDLIQLKINEFKIGIAEIVSETNFLRVHNINYHGICGVVKIKENIYDEILVLPIYPEILVKKIKRKIDNAVIGIDKTKLIHIKEIDQKYNVYKYKNHDKNILSNPILEYLEYLYEKEVFPIIAVKETFIFIYFEHLKDFLNPVYLNYDALKSNLLKDICMMKYIYELLTLLTENLGNF